MEQRRRRDPVPAAASRAVEIPFDARHLDADLVPARGNNGLILFAHGSGSGRRSPRNREVARGLKRLGFGTLLLDLLDPAEARADEANAAYRFDIPLLTGRLIRATEWLLGRPETAARPLGFYGASTGGAVALRAAVAHPEAVRAIVLRGARSDLADAVVSEVRCPTLFLVGSEDPEVRALNEATYSLLRAPKRLVVVPGAGHLFEEPGALEAVSRETAEWFRAHLGPSPTPPRPPGSTAPARPDRPGREVAGRASPGRGRVRIDPSYPGGPNRMPCGPVLTEAAARASGTWSAGGSTAGASGASTARS